MWCAMKCLEGKVWQCGGGGGVLLQEVEITWRWNRDGGVSESFLKKLAFGLGLEGTEDFAQGGEEKSFQAKVTEQRSEWQGMVWAG